MVAPLVAAGLGGILMGLGYTTGAYAGYGFWNNKSIDPFGVHSKGNTNKPTKLSLSGMAYGMSGYGSYRRRYRYSRYRRYGRYSRYRRRSYYRRRYY